MNESIDVNDLMRLAASGDSAAINVLDMMDANESGARTADGQQLAAWYRASKSEDDPAPEEEKHRKQWQEMYATARAKGAAIDQRRFGRNK